jgi:hypothetical protein
VADLFLYSSFLLFTEKRLPLQQLSNNQQATQQNNIDFVAPLTNKLVSLKQSLSALTAKGRTEEVLDLCWTSVVAKDEGARLEIPVDEAGLIA